MIYSVEMPFLNTGYCRIAISNFMPSSSAVMNPPKQAQQLGVVNRSPSEETASEVLQAFSFSDPTIVSDVLSIREAVGSYLYLPLQNYFWFPDVSRIDLSRRFTRAAF